MEFEDTWLFVNFEVAMDVHKQLFTLLREKGFVTYTDLMCMFDKINNFTDKVYPDEFDNYGWTNLFGVKVELYGNDWGINMPELENLKKESK